MQSLDSIEEIKIIKEDIETFPVSRASTASTTSTTSTSDITTDKAKISFSDIDYEIDTKGTENSKIAPKTVEHLEQLSSEKKVLNFVDDDDDDKLTIGENINLDILEIDDVFSQPKLKLNDDPILDDIVILS